MPIADRNWLLTDVRPDILRTLSTFQVGDTLSLRNPIAFAMSGAPTHDGRIVAKEAHLCGMMTMSDFSTTKLYTILCVDWGETYSTSPPADIGSLSTRAMHGYLSRSHMSEDWRDLILRVCADRDAAQKALSARLWLPGPPPKDGEPFLISGRLTWQEEEGGGSQPVLCQARYGQLHGGGFDWLDADGLTIRGTLRTTLHIDWHAPLPPS